MLNIKNARPGSLGLNKRKLIVYVIVIILVIAGILLYQKHQNNKKIAPEEQRSAQQNQQYLFSGDYKSYQLRLTGIADGYTAVKDYGNSERVLNEIVANVPSNKIISDTYRSYWYLYKQNGDTSNRKKYAKLAAEKLKQEGQTQEAAAFEQDANGK